MSRDRVTPEVALFVFDRDQGCVAPRLGGTFMECWGRNRLEHVQPGYGRMSHRAPSCPCSLATVCEGHAEPGMRRGYVWATDHANRDRLRGLLAAFAYGAHTPDHAALILSASEHDKHVDRCAGCPPLKVSA